MTLAAACLAATAAAAVSPDAPKFSARAELVRIDVVVARRGHPLTGLTADDFIVDDDGVRRTVTMVSRAEENLHAVLLFDLSGSMAGERLRRLQEGAAGFLTRLDPGDRATIATFTDVVHRWAGPVEPNEAAAVLPRLVAGGTTSLHDAVSAALVLARGTRLAACVLLVTDGIDELNWSRREQVLQLARHADVPVYVLAVGDQLATAAEPTGAADGWQGLFEGFAQFLGQVATETGGTVVFAEEDVQPAFEKLVPELRNRYSLVFERDPEAPRGWHELKVRLKRGKGAVRTRRGYFVR